MKFTVISINKVDEKQKTEHYICIYPTNPYAGTKAGAELIAQSYAHSFKMQFFTTIYKMYTDKFYPK